MPPGDIYVRSIPATRRWPLSGRTFMAFIAFIAFIAFMAFMGAIFGKCELLRAGARSANLRGCGVVAALAYSFYRVWAHPSCIRTQHWLAEASDRTAKGWPNKPCWTWNINKPGPANLQTKTIIPTRWSQQTPLRLNTPNCMVPNTCFLSPTSPIVTGGNSIDE